MNPFIVGASAIGHAMSMTRIRFGGAHVVPSGGISNCTSALVGMMSFLVGVSAASLDLSVLGTEDRVPGARSGRFVMAEAFAVCGSIGGHAVGAVGFNFRKYFYPLVETEAAEPPVDAWTLGRSADDATLIAMVGGKDRVVISLSAIHRIMARGSHGDSHVDGQSNFAYARSPVDGRL